MNPKMIQDLDRFLAGRYYIAEEGVRGLSGALWNGTADIQTQALVKCHTPSDVQIAVQLAAENDLSVSALSGGHDWVGRAISRSGLTLDLRELNSAHVDLKAQTLTLGGGALVKDALAMLPADHAFVSGVHTKVGAAGLALSGGYGKLNYRHGLVTDTMQEARVVLADGSVTVASRHQEPDLFWALQGAGKNFAVLTSITFKIYAIPQVLNGVFFFPLEHAVTALSEVQALLEEAGDRLSIFCSFTRVPKLGFGLVAELLWAEQAQPGERYADRLASLAGATVLKREWVAYRDIYDESGDALWPSGEGYEMDSHNLPMLTAPIIEQITELARQSPSEQNCIMLHDFHGTAAAISEHATAFALRSNHFNMQVVGRWDPEDSEAAETTHDWLLSVRKAMQSYCMRGGYPAVLGPDRHDQAQNFYGATVPRLRQIKHQYDKANRFAADFGIL